MGAGAKGPSQSLHHAYLCVNHHKRNALDHRAHKYLQSFASCSARRIGRFIPIEGRAERQEGATFPADGNVNKKKLRKLKGWKAILGLVVIGLGALYELVHFLEAIDFVMEFMERPVVRLIFEWAKRPEIVLIFILLGFLWLSFTLRTEEEDDDGDEKQVRLAPPAPPAPVVQERVIVRPARAKEAAAPVDPPPNIIVLDCAIMPVDWDEWGRFTLSLRIPGPLRL